MYKTLFAEVYFMPDIQLHSFSCEARKSLRINGVKDVQSFDDSEITLITLCGGMTIEGEGLHIGVLNVEQGRVEVDGRVDGIYYFDESPAPKRGLFGRK